MRSVPRVEGGWGVSIGKPRGHRFTGELLRRRAATGHLVASWSGPKISVDARACSGRHPGPVKKMSLIPTGTPRSGAVDLRSSLACRSRASARNASASHVPKPGCPTGFRSGPGVPPEFHRGDLSLPDSGCRFSNAQFVQRPQRNAGPVRVTTGGDRARNTGRVGQDSNRRKRVVRHARSARPRGTSQLRYACMASSIPRFDRRDGTRHLREFFPLRKLHPPPGHNPRSARRSGRL
ncbi:MAG: hypothetical protein Ct9H300mP16_00850 [Pseudomonadota bacterium]|nr:MAG: hypothetical protein Ct9H300mP16_00850 [Pseudomonadota bacterium]